MDKLVILGSGSFAKEVVCFINLIGEYEIVGFIDRDKALKGKKIYGIPILGGDIVLKKLSKNKVKKVFVAVGMSKVREELFNKACDSGLEPVSLIHPSSVIAPNVKLGRGVVVYPNATLNTEVELGDSVLINSNVSIGHDTKVGDFVNINPGANIAGKVIIKRHAFLGIGCSILQNLVIGEEAIVGGGALVRKNVPAFTTVVGVPAVPIKNLK